MDTYWIKRTPLLRHSLYNNVQKATYICINFHLPRPVLCGIMRLSFPQIILGTTPVVFLILPTCVTGALLYMASLKDESGNPEFSLAGTVSTITASLTALVQFGSMIVAAYYLEQTATNELMKLRRLKMISK